MERTSGTYHRAGIYFFYDQDGIVDRYVPAFLSDLAKNLSLLVVVVNGTLTPEGKKAFRSITPHMIIRKNEGLDVHAYKAAIDYLGWDKLAAFDELVLCNHTIMGPVHPLKETFDKMAAQPDLDFWGVTLYHEIQGYDPFGSPYGYIPQHIQSNFIVYRNRFMQTEDLHHFWANMRPIANYNESVAYYESYFTKYFGDLGYKWAVSVDTTDLEIMTDYPLVFYPVQLIRDRGCPFFKRRQFLSDYTYYIANSIGQSTRELYDYLRLHTDYDIGLLWENLLRTANQNDLLYQLQLMFPVESRAGDRAVAAEACSRGDVCLVMHLYFDDLVEDSFQQACNMPESTHVYITTDTEEKKCQIEKVFARRNWGHLDVRLIENRGRDVSSLLVGVADVIMGYQVCCFVHDKKTAQLRPGSIGEGFSIKCFSNTLGSPAFCDGVIRLFQEDPFLGMLSPPPPNHGVMFSVVGNEWTVNFDNTKALAAALGINVPMSRDKAPIAPLGTMFWFRPAALKALYSNGGKGWTYEDFPPEPNNIDGTLLHAIERVYPYAVQGAGFYPAYVLSPEMTRNELITKHYYLQEINRTAGEFDIICPAHEFTVHLRNSFILYLREHERMKRIPKPKLLSAIRQMVPKRLQKPLVMLKRKLLGPDIPWEE